MPFDLSLPELACWCVPTPPRAREDGSPLPVSLYRLSKRSGHSGKYFCSSACLAAYARTNLPDYAEKSEAAFYPHDDDSLRVYVVIVVRKDSIAGYDDSI